MRVLASLDLTSALSDMAKVYPWLADVADNQYLPEDVLTRMHVALEEAVANVAMHGFAPGVTGQVTLRLHEVPGSLLLEVEDNGAAFDPTAAAAPDAAAGIAEATLGGRGLTLIRKCCEEVTYARKDDRNHLNMRFPLPGKPKF